MAILLKPQRDIEECSLWGTLKATLNGHNAYRENLGIFGRDLF